MFCLPAQEAQKIKQAIKSGKLNPETLNNMTSAQRRKFLAEIVSISSAKQINLLFEKKLLLINQEKAMTDWAREITGMSAKQKEETLDKIKKTYEEKKRRLEDPKENEEFLNEIIADTYSKKFKTELTLEEAQQITELAQDKKRAKEKLGDITKWKTDDFVLTGSKEDAIDFGAKEVALNNYIGGLKAEANKELFVNPFKVHGLMEKASALKLDAKIAANFIADNARTLKATLDNSLWLRQGIKVLFTHPTIWAPNFAKSWKNIAQTLKGGTKVGDAVLDAEKALVYSRENYMKGRYERGKKLDIGSGEEEILTSTPTMIPIVGRWFKASEVAYEAGAMRMRADIADKKYQMAEQQGVDLNNKVEIGSINELVNSMTGRGSLGRAEGAGKLLNKAFFSAKFFKSNLDVLTNPFLGKTSFVRKQAAINLLKMASSMAVILMISKGLDDDSVEWDSRSANFGKIKAGDKRFDVTGGMSSLLVLASRIATQSTKSSVTDVVTEFDGGYGAPDGMDMLWNFTENKFSPVFSVIKQLVEQKTFEGEKPTVMNQLKNLTIPIVIEQGYEAAQRETMANTLLVIIADALGVSANVYSYNKNWDIKPGKILTQFKEQVGTEIFEEANDEYNKKVNEKIRELNNDSEYKAKSDEDKQNQLTSEKAKIKNQIFKQHKFTYKKDK